MKNYMTVQLKLAYQKRITHIQTELAREKGKDNPDMDAIQMYEYYLNNYMDELYDVAADMNIHDEDIIKAAEEMLWPEPEPKVRMYNKMMDTIKNISWLRVNFLLLMGLFGLYLCSLASQAYLARGWDGLVQFVLMCGLSLGLGLALTKVQELKAQLTVAEARR